MVECNSLLWTIGPSSCIEAILFCFSINSMSTMLLNGCILRWVFSWPITQIPFRKWTDRNNNSISWTERCEDAAPKEEKSNLICSINGSIATKRTLISTSVLNYKNWCRRYGIVMTYQRKKEHCFDFMNTKIVGLEEHRTKLDILEIDR